MSDKKIICKCPKCGKNVVENKFSYNCEDLNSGCDFKFYKNYWGVEITEELIKSLCEGKTSSEYTFQKDGTEWKGSLVYSKEKGKIISLNANKNKAEIIGKCPCNGCNGNVKVTEKFYMCENYKNGCSFILGKDLRGHNLTKDEAIKLINGETLPKNNFKWKNGKSSEVECKLDEDGRIKFIFE